MKKIIVLLALISFMPITTSAERLWTGGAELNTTTDLVETDTNGATQAISTATKRSGLASWEYTTSGSNGTGFSGIRFLNAAASNTYYWRGYINVATCPSVSNAVLSAVAVGADAEASIMLNTDCTLSLTGDDGSTVIDSDATVLSTGTWYRLEMAYNGADSIDVVLDGSTVLSVGVHDGDSVNGFRWGICTHTAAACAQGSWFFDDVAINDTTGSAQTSYAGAGSVVAMQPDSAGDTNNCTSGDYTSVDEVTPDDGTSVCLLDTDGDILDVNTESSSSAGIDSYDTITLVQVGVRSAATGAANETWNPRIKSASGGTVTSGSSVTHNDTTYRTNGDAEPQMTYKLVSYTDPTTGIAWTPTGTNSLDNMQIGLNASAATLADVNLSTLWAMVEYVDGTPPVVPSGVTNFIFRFGTMIVNGLMIVK